MCNAGQLGMGTGYTRRGSYTNQTGSEVNSFENISKSFRVIVEDSRVPTYQQSVDLTSMMMMIGTKYQYQQ